MMYSNFSYGENFLKSEKYNKKTRKKKTKETYKLMHADTVVCNLKYTIETHKYRTKFKQIYILNNTCIINNQQKGYGNFETRFPKLLPLDHS